MLGRRSKTSWFGVEGTITCSLRLNSHNPVDESKLLKLKTSES